MKHSIPEAALAQHMAVLGKTGSGKTSTAKLAVEQVVEAGSRVCILDPIKSDWWGLTSSADGKRPGLPFHILGGPRAHVGLHASAGKAIGELVATGALPLSILDMADFAPGGQSHFFTDFAPTLIRKMRGVLYLVIEEAHLFAPKERSGVGKENLSIHWAKTLATAGRSRGIRMIVLTQRTQALHNALLGSCDTMIVHRMTAPADQEPVVKWLKANVQDEEIRDQVVEGMSSLKTGSGWLCSGEAKIFELIQFPRIHTYDNSATPTGDLEEHAVKTAPVDAEKLRAIIGEAVKEAEENDPAALKKRIAELEAKAERDRPNLIDEKVDNEILQREIAQARAEEFERGYSMAIRDAWPKMRKAFEERLDTVRGAVAEAIEAVHENLSFEGDTDSLPRPLMPTRPVMSITTHPAPPKLMPATRDALVDVARAAADGGGAARRILIALAEAYGHANNGHVDGLSGRKLAILADVKRGGSTWRGALAGLRKLQHVEDNGEHFRITSAGLRALGKYSPLPKGKALRDYWQAKIGNGTRGQIFAAILAGAGNPVSAERVAAAASVELGGSTWRGHMAHLRGLELVTGSDQLRASEELFT